MYTKEQLIDRQFIEQDEPETIYTFKELIPKGWVITWEEEGYQTATHVSNWSLQDSNDYISKGRWKLLPQEQIMHTTRIGIKYKVGTKFTELNDVPSHSIIYTITAIDKKSLTLEWVSPRLGKQKENTPKNVLEDKMDRGIARIGQDYQLVDPLTITFDFTNTKIKVNSLKENEWVQKVALNSGWSWYSGDTSVLEYRTNEPYLFFNETKGFGYGDNINYFNENKSKEITIQDILSNQTRRVIEVGDIVEVLESNGSDLNPGEKVQVTRVGKTEIVVTGDWYFARDSGQLKLVSKANKQEIIGYELLKDLPFMKSGTIFQSGNKKVYAADDTQGNRLNYKVEALQDTAWFKPIYKAKEVELKFSKYAAMLSKEHGLVFTDNERISFTALVGLLKTLQVNGFHTSVNTYEVKYKMEVTEVEVGCKKFDKKDVEIVCAAIKDLPE